MIHIQWLLQYFFTKLCHWKDSPKSVSTLLKLFYANHYIHICEIIDIIICIINYVAVKQNYFRSFPLPFTLSDIFNAVNYNQMFTKGRNKAFAQKKDRKINLRISHLPELQTNYLKKQSFADVLRNTCS